MKKVFHSAEQAIDGLIFDGMKIAAGGFGLCGIPEDSIAALKKSGIKNLIIACCIADALHQYIDYCRKYINFKKY